MTVEELKAKLDAGETPCVLDVREGRELAVARYPFPVLNIPMAQVPARLDEIPKDRTVVCACRSGSRSAHIAAYLRTHGRDAVNLDGGILAWSARIDSAVPVY